MFAVKNPLILIEKIETLCKTPGRQNSGHSRCIDILIAPPERSKHIVPLTHKPCALRFHRTLAYMYPLQQFCAHNLRS